LPGIDHIQVELIQAGGETLKSEVHKFINFFGNKKELSQQWKESYCTYLQEEDYDYSNYQGISLVSTSYKIVSNIILSRFIPTVDKIIGGPQCVFQCSR
jgi:hypothetical protein